MGSTVIRQLVEVIKSLLTIIDTDAEVIRGLKQQLQIQEMNEKE